MITATAQEYADIVISEIADDAVHDSRIRMVTKFSDLQDIYDANEYLLIAEDRLGLSEIYKTDEWHELMTLSAEAIDIVNKWIAGWTR